MRIGNVLRLVLVGIGSLVWVASISAQQVRFFPDFSSVAYLQMNGSAHQATYNSAKILRLTDGYPGIGATHPETAASWFSLPQPVSSGFTTYFKFQIDTAAICCAPADGLAFVIQNSSTAALGSGNGGIGYAGIPNSVAVEFDTHQDPWDPNANHVAVQSCGTGANAPQHIVGNCLVGTGINSSIPHLGVTCGSSGPCTNGRTHEVVIEYTPPASGHGNGTLVVWIDPQFYTGTHTPVANAVKAINIPYNIDNAQNPQGISLAGGTSAWVGFTASQTAAPEAHDILAWEFTPHTPVQVTQVIPNGGITADYIFGVHDMGVTYFSGFTNDVNDPYLMTVVATPTPRSVFYNTRLLGTQFINEQCIVYLETGGNCIVYSVTCQRQSNPNVNVTCPSTNNCTSGDFVNCITFSTSFTTTDGVSAQNADYLKADPIGSNNWVSIFNLFQANVFDPKTTGTGNTPSDFAATFFVGTKP